MFLKRYSSCRYNERQLIYITVVRRASTGGNAQQSPSCRWWLQVGGVLQKKRYIQRQPPPMEKQKGKKREKKEEVRSTGIELANFDLIDWCFHPYATAALIGKQRSIFPNLNQPGSRWYPTLKPRQFFHTKTKRLSEHPDRQTNGQFFFSCM